ncbi:MAG: tRNA pseudouridine(38-40) synthase TruA [Planctomycetota bacterium]|nr:tRNA pseudouridine(38-40) synthase TruA [Planctomycetota bacterium]
MKNSRSGRPGGRKPARGGATYRLDVEYDGTGFHGWQYQKNARSVAGELSKAIEQAGGQVRELGGSGRTDAGVHALGQVAYLRLSAEADAEKLLKGLNGALPNGIHVSSLLRAADGFHARHDAVRRSYLYQIIRRRTAFSRRYAWSVGEHLDVALMANAAQSFVGRHDFSRFCERPKAQTSTIVVVDDVQVVESGELLLVRISASHFLWRMVRRLVGSLVQVGTGRMSPDELAKLVKEPTAPGELPSKSTAPSSGLFLERVEYPGEPPVGSVLPAFPRLGSGLAYPPFLGAHAASDSESPS